MSLGQSLLFSLPLHEFVIRQRIEKKLGQNNFPLEDIRLPFAPGFAADEPRYRFPPAGYNDFLSGLNLRQKPGQVSFGLTNVTYGNDQSPRLPVIQLII